MLTADTAAPITFATSMLAIRNPIGAVAIFAGMTCARSEADRQSIAIRCGIAVAVIFVGIVAGSCRVADSFRQRRQKQDRLW